MKRYEAFSSKAVVASPEESASGKENRASVLIEIGTGALGQDNAP
jgi:hypothetical protein